MMYLVYDCLSDTEVGIFPTFEEAEHSRKLRGGECTHVFEVYEAIKPVEIKEKKPSAGELFLVDNR